MSVGSRVAGSFASPHLFTPTTIGTNSTKASGPSASTQKPSVFVRIILKLHVRGSSDSYAASPFTEES